MQLPLWKVFAFFSLYSVITLLFLPFTARLISRYGSKTALVSGICFLVPYLFSISQISNFPGIVFWIPLIGGIYEALFWPAFHYDMCHIAKQKGSGKKIAFLSTVVIVATAVAPLAGGLVATHIDPRLIFWMGSGLILFSMIPLALSPMVHKPLPFSLKKIWKQERNKKPNHGVFASFFGGSIVAAVGGTVWPLIMYLEMRDYSAIGAVTAGTTLIIVFILNLLGKKIDKASAKKSSFWAVCLQLLAWAGTLLAFWWSWLTVVVITILDAIRRMGGSIIWMTLDHSIYVHAANHPKNPLYIIWIRQMGINLAIASLNGLLALWFYYDSNSANLSYAAIAALLFAPLQLMIFKYNGRLKTKVTDEVQELGDASQA